MNEQDAIGVVGGLGPYAGLDLVKKIFDETKAVSDQEHLPVALISFPGRIPDRSAYIADQRAPSPLPALNQILRQLDELGCSVAGIPCNTAHAPVILDALAAMLDDEQRRLELVNMIDVSADAVVTRFPGARSVGVLGTTATLRTGLYTKALQERGLEPVLPDEHVQETMVSPAIFDTTWGLKAKSNPPDERARQALVDASENLRERGAEVVILGCTELPLAIPEAELAGLPMLDSTRSLARALIERTHPERLRPLT